MATSQEIIAMMRKVRAFALFSPLGTKLLAPSAGDADAVSPPSTLVIFFAISFPPDFNIYLEILMPAIRFQKKITYTGRDINLVWNYPGIKLPFVQIQQVCITNIKKYFKLWNYLKDNVTICVGNLDCYCVCKKSNSLTFRPDIPDNSQQACGRWFP